MWKSKVKKFIEFITCNKLRVRQVCYQEPELKWLYIDSFITKTFNHGGWVYLNLSWMRRHFRTAK